MKTKGVRELKNQEWMNNHGSKYGNERSIFFAYLKERELKVADVNVVDLNHYYDHLKKTKMSTLNTFNSHTSFLISFFEVYAEELVNYKKLIGHLKTSEFRVIWDIKLSE